MMITHIAIVSLPVSDQTRALDFYRDVLGFEVVRDNPFMPTGARWIEVRPFGARTSFTLVTWFETMMPGSMTGTVLEVNDLDATYAELQARGLALSAIDDAPWGRYATFTDPDGNGFVLQHSRMP
jgi:catechol 2,3-dioxygenase-like lactoylglutathione lyase family enzyme